ncbi:hypothetical protein B0T24DRAFT_223847 [Lasiosphaeria ovina]|uniref:Uncharacterized protein n=1 Tax=Lasiosphaeria ovina TaxID=92902 RepID=A0AAE0NAV2_9PEZI|nr:hypothetical protein B0T24DRAFT_223847 [Lasiosphaeria ovina]
MAPPRKPKQSATKSKASSSSSSELPAPFKLAPEKLKPLYSNLSKKHVYVAHVDSRPRDFKRKIFVVPVLMNVAVALLFALRMWYVAPWYLHVVTSTLGYANETTVRAADLSWRAGALLVLRRCFTFILDFSLAVFVWPWPIEFVFGPIMAKDTRGTGSPVGWRWVIGFRDQEIYVRRSRSWDQALGDVTADAAEGAEGRERNVLWAHVREAMSPLLLQQKTGYLTMNADWDLDWSAMVHATTLVDTEIVPLDTFRSLVLLHHKQHGWLILELATSETPKEEERRRQVFAFRDALQALGKEDLFYRWIEIIQYETSQPGGFSTERQAEVAHKVRDLFKASGIDFDNFWKESVGSDTIDGL